MTISISDTSHSNRYQWRSQANSRPVEDALGVAELLAPSQEPVQRIDYDEAVDRYYDNGSASLAAALWEMESARAAKASQQVATVEPDTSNENPVSYGLGAWPAEIMRTHILQSMGLSEGDLADMLPTERANIENKIEAAIMQQRLD